MQWMLEKKENEKIELLAFLREQLTADISVKTVGEALGWSKYLTITVAHQLAEDLMTIYDDEEEPLLSVQQDDKMLHMPMSRHVNTDAVMLVYLRESLYWTFIKEVFFETITSYEDFAERFLTTVSTTRNIKRYVVKHLAPLGIGIDDEYHFTGDESAIRVFFYRLALRFFGDREFPYGEDLKIQADAGIDRLAAAIMPKSYIRDSKRIALRFYYTIAALRVRTGHFVDPHNLDNVLRPNDQMDALTQALIQKMVADSLTHDTINEAQAIDEARETLFYLYALNIVGETDWFGNLTPTLQQRLTAIVGVIGQYHEQYFNALMSAVSAEKIKRDLFAPVLTFELYARDSGHRRRFDLREAYRMYPVLVEMALNVSREIAPLVKQPVRDAEELFFSYLFTAFVAHFEPAVIFPPIKVDIDITYRPALEVILKRMIAGMAEFNIVFTNRFKDDVDLVISDAMLTDVDSRYRFDWQHLPNVKELEQLRTRLSELKAQKFATRFERHEIAE
ncbi:helix-turn-helix domain-containing protein [Weissella cibaria]|uniref:Mga helix-turn-helix domain-containing protein n=1 Tax=Weissella cibaria TaxID=137591 RepID=A0A9Q8N926_9LACO|nr:helix-turn-helix domain-containing protein [Weissella cibaria]TVV27777.1 hypothetical protein FO435_07740 [Weissella cibaria]TVV40969.1 hypothetical protein FO438_07570 [Weissella cibaria]